MTTTSHPVTSVVVYCGSSSGRSPAFVAAAHELGALLAHERVRLVYGGGHVGLMGAVADACLAHGGEVIGVITEALLGAEVGHHGLTRLEVVPTMHERKARMAELSDACIALPGGFGTFDELFEMVTWTQLGLQAKAVCVLDVDGFFAPLLEFVRGAEEAGFIRAEHVALLQSATGARECLDVLRSAPPPPTPKWQ